MAGDDPGEFRIVQFLEVLRNGDVLCSAIVATQPPIGRLPDQALNKPVLAPLGRTGVVFDVEQLEIDERAQLRFEVLGTASLQSGERSQRKGLPEHCAILEEASLIRGEPIEPCPNDGLESVGKCHFGAVAHIAELATLLDQVSRCAEHPDDLHCVKRKPGDPFDDLIDDLVAYSRYVLGDEPAHLGLRQRSEAHSHRAPVLGSPVGSPVEKVGPSKRYHEDRRARRPLYQLAYEVEQALVRPVEVLEDEHHRALKCDVLKERPESGEQLRSRVRRHLSQAQETIEPWLDPLPVLLVGDELGQHRSEACTRVGRFLAFYDARPATDDLSQGPERHAISVGG